MLKLLYQCDRDTFKSHYLVVNKRTTKILSCLACIEIKEPTFPATIGASRFIYDFTNRCDVTSIRTRFFVEPLILCGDRERILFEFNNLSALKSVSMSVFSLSSSSPLMRTINVFHLQCSMLQRTPPNNKGIKQHRHNDFYGWNTKNDGKLRT